MTHRPCAAIGFKPRTGCAVVVALGGDAAAPTVLWRAEVPLLPAGEFAPYHAAEGLAPAAAQRHIEASIARAQRLATQALDAAAQRCSAAGHRVLGCAVLVGRGMPAWTTEQILAVHVRMHQAEGELFRQVLLDAARERGVALTTLPDNAALEAASQRLGLARARLDAELARLGHAAGAPWGRHQKEAAAAAWVALRAGDA
jgi:hypothetical protein